MKTFSSYIAALLIMLCVAMASGQTATVTDVTVDEGPNPSTKYVVVHLSVGNNQDTAVTLENTRFSLLDSQNRFYESASNLDGSGVWFSIRLNPRAAQMATLWFEVPSNFDLDIKTVKLAMRGPGDDTDGNYEEFPLHLKLALAPEPWPR
jgi:hypothetical protein